MADILVLVLTWVKTYKQVVYARRAGQTMSVSLCLLRDGQWTSYLPHIIYFTPYSGTVYFMYAAFYYRMPLFF